LENFTIFDVFIDYFKVVALGIEFFVKFMIRSEKYQKSVDFLEDYHNR